MKDAELQTQVDAITSNNVPLRHTFFQLNFFVLGKEPTHQAKMRKCVEELRARKGSVESCRMEIHDIQDRSALMEIEFAKSNFPTTEEADIRRRMLTRRLHQNERDIAKLEETIKNTEEEMVFFVEAFNRLNQIEAFKQWDDISVQAEYWNAKLTEEVNHRLVMQMPIDFEIVRTVLALPHETPVKKKVAALIQRNVDKVLSLTSKDSISVVA